MDATTFYTLTTDGGIAVFDVDEDAFADEEGVNGWIAVFGTREEALEFGGSDEPDAALQPLAMGAERLRGEIAAARVDGLLTLFHGNGEPRPIRAEDVAGL